MPMMIAICKLCADDPLNEVELELVKVFADGVQITLSCNACNVELLEGIGDALSLLS
jgi:hypothetical protein